MNDSLTVRFLYKTSAGRLFLKVLQQTRFDRVMVRFLRSDISRFIVPMYVKLNHVDLSDCEKKDFSSFRDFFMRKRVGMTTGIDFSIRSTSNRALDEEMTDDDEAVYGIVSKDAPGDSSGKTAEDETNLISLCDGYLSAYKVRPDAHFTIKGMDYTVQDLAPGLESPGDDKSTRFENGVCLIFRLCASDYHHYIYFDDCLQGTHHYIEGELNSVQNCACEAFPVYVRNRRTWSILKTAHFGDVLETEVGAFVVGGIVNHVENNAVTRGDYKGHFDLSGSTIVLLFEKDKIVLDARLREGLKRGGEVRVRMGEKIGRRK